MISFQICFVPGLSFESFNGKICGVNSIHPMDLVFYTHTNSLTAQFVSGSERGYRGFSLILTRYRYGK